VSDRRPLASLLLLALGACTRPAPATPIGRATPNQPGVTVAVYGARDASYALVEDRRELVVGASPVVLLGDIDPGADLRSLQLDVITGGRGLALGACSRESITPATSAIETPEHYEIVEDANGEAQVIEIGGGAIGFGARTPIAPALEAVPTIRCDVRGAAGTYLVRLVYVTRGFGFRARSQLSLTTDATGAGRASVTSRFAVTTPVSGRGRADLVLYEGTPGGTKAPREVGRSTIALDGSVAIIAGPTRDANARLLRVYYGAAHVAQAGVAPGDPRWSRESQPVVRAILELEGERPIGDIDVTIIDDGELHELVVGAGSKNPDEPKTIPLWVEPDLRGGRERGTEARAGLITDRVQLSIANRGARPREVWVVERVRPTKTAKLVAWTPKASAKPALGTKHVRTKLTIAPHEIGRTSFVLEYR